MKIWAIGDLHLSFGIKNKSMDIFGAAWENHAERLKDSWNSLITPQDLILIPGDISWAMKLPEALPDLAWIHALPGTKVMIKGNHDLWWDSLSKLKQNLPSSIHVIQNDIFSWQDRVFVGGARLWDSDEYNFDKWIDFILPPEQAHIDQKKHEYSQGDRDIFRRELLRLEESLKKLPKEIGSNSIRICMTHYPPIGPDLAPSQASGLCQKYGISKVVFGHLHSLKPELKERQLFGASGGIEYILTSCDWLSCTPRLIHSLEPS